MSVSYCLNCLTLLGAGLFVLAMLRGLKVWGVLLFAFGVLLFVGVSLADRAGPEFVSLAFLVAVGLILALFVGDKVIAGALFVGERLVAFLGAWWGAK